jgi:hypothetical protein
MNSFSKSDKSNLFQWKFIWQPKRTRAYVDEVMDWANLAVEGHFMLKSLGGIIERLAKPLGKIMGHCHLKLL